jgi:hypothetical protein
MCSFYVTKTVRQQQRGWRELRDLQMVYGERHLLQKTARGKHVDILEIMILNWNIANIIVFYAAGLVLLNIQISESHNSRQCDEWLLKVRQHSE